MNNQIFHFGNEALSSLSNALETLRPKKIFLLSGKASFSACGAKDLLYSIFSDKQINVTHWSDFKENPKIEDVESGLKLLNQSEPDLIIACGGGSVIDMAKLIRFAYSYDGNLIESNFNKVRNLLPLIAIPTTSGTGAEATPFAVCYKNGTKYSVEHKDILPDYAIIYPPFTYNNPPYLTACTGFDALAQATEAYWNVNATPESDEYALKALRLIHDNLFEAYKHNKKEARDYLALGSYYAGKAIAITKTTAPHAFSYAFTTLCSYPHGHAVALTFPFFFELNTLRFCNKLQTSLNPTLYVKRMQTLCDIFGVTPDTCLNKIKTYIEFIELKYKGLGIRNINDILNKVNLQRLKNNPVIVEKKTVVELKQYIESLTIDL